jgi:precorrin-3B synthase
MESGDGLIVRLRAGARGIHASHVRALAQLAEQYGNGQIELTRRSNIQLRGIWPGTLIDLQSSLVELGLVEESPELEARLALLVDPRSGLDAECARLEPLAGAVEAALRGAEPATFALPPKFGIVLDGSGALTRVAADIRLEARPSAPDLVFVSMERRADEAQRERGDHSRSRLDLGTCQAADAPALVLRLMAALDPAVVPSDPEDHDELLRAIMAPYLRETPRLPFAPLWASRPWIGFHPGRTGWFGLGVPFGAADPDQWRVLAQLAERFGDGELRVTPWRGVVLAGVPATHASALGVQARAAGLITDPTDPLLRVVACVGAPACQSGHGETRTLARSLSDAALPMIDQHTTLHVSGCSKSCAFSGAAAITLVHGPDGCKLGFGVDAAHAVLGPALSLEQAHAQLKSRARAGHERVAP